MGTDPASLDDRSPEVIGVVIAMIALSTFAVILRWWPRLLSQTADFWWDDWTALIALPFNLALGAITLYWVSIGLGKHVDSASADAAAQLFTFWITNFFFNTALSLVKVSVLLFYARVFRTTPFFKIALYSTAFLVVGWWVTANVLTVAQCQPVSRFWYRDDSDAGTCLSLNTVLLGLAAPNVVIDLVLMVLPLPILFKLHVALVQRIALASLFVLGYCVIILSVLRLVFVMLLPHSVEHDPSWLLTANAILYCVESSLAIISICSPRIFNMVRKNLTSGSSHYSRSPGGTYNANPRRFSPLRGPAPLRMGHLADPLERLRLGGQSPEGGHLRQYWYGRSGEESRIRKPG